MTKAQPGYLSIKDAADHLGISRRTIERAVENRHRTKIPCQRDPLTGRWRFRLDRLDAWWEGQPVKGGTS